MLMTGQMVCSAPPRKKNVEQNFRPHSKMTPISKTQVQTELIQYNATTICNLIIFYKSIILFEFMLSSKTNFMRERPFIEIYRQQFKMSLLI